MCVIAPRELQAPSRKRTVGGLEGKGRGGGEIRRNCLGQHRLYGAEDVGDGSVPVPGTQQGDLRRQHHPTRVCACELDLRFPPPGRKGGRGGGVSAPGFSRNRGGGHHRLGRQIQRRGCRSPSCSPPFPNLPLESPPEDGNVLVSGTETHCLRVQAAWGEVDGRWGKGAEGGGTWRVGLTFGSVKIICGGVLGYSMEHSMSRE